MSSKKEIKCVTLSPENISDINSAIDVRDPLKKDFSKALNYMLRERRALVSELSGIQKSKELFSDKDKLHTNN